MHTKLTIISIKTNFTYTNLKDIFMHKIKQKLILSSLAAILDAILYQGSLINCSQLIRSHFEPFLLGKTCI